MSVSGTGYGDEVFNDKPYAAVNREERHYCSLLAHALLSSSSTRQYLVEVLRERIDASLDPEHLAVFVEAAVLRDYWYDLGDPAAYTDQTGSARRAVVEQVLGMYETDPAVIDRHALFWTPSTKPKLWYPGRWNHEALVAAGLEKLKTPRWAFRAIPDLLLTSPGVAVFIEAKLESGEGKDESGYSQYAVAKEIAKLVKALVPSFADGFVGPATLGRTGTTITWAELEPAVSSSDLDAFTKDAFKRLAAYAPSWASPTKILGSQRADPV